MVPKKGDIVRFSPEFIKYLEDRGDSSWFERWYTDLEIESCWRRTNGDYRVAWKKIAGKDSDDINYIGLDENGVGTHSGVVIFVPVHASSCATDPICTDCNVPMEYVNFAYKCPRCWKRA